jgi:hypothetical protein
MEHGGRQYETWLLDYKRAGNVYPENVLQAEGYAGADWLMLTGPDGELTPVAMPRIDHVGIVHINAEHPRGYVLRPVPDHLRPDLFSYFRYAQHMAHFAETGDRFIGDPIEPPTWEDEPETESW